MLTLITILKLLNQDVDQVTLFPDMTLDHDRVFIEEGYREWPTNWYFNEDDSLHMVTVLNEHLTTEEYNSIISELKELGMELEKSGYLDQNHAEEIWYGYYFCVKMIYKVSEEKLFMSIYRCK